MTMCLVVGRRGSGRFVLTTPVYLGNLHYKWIWQDICEEHPQWFLRECIIRDMQGGRTQHFVYNNWLGLDTHRNSSVTAKIHADDSAVGKFSSKMWRDMYHKHMLLGIFSNISHVSFTYLQRVICSLVFMLTLMALNVFLIGRSFEFYTEFKIDYKPFLIGFLSGTLVFILNLLLTLFFAAADFSKPKTVKKMSQDIVRNLSCKCEMANVATNTGDSDKSPVEKRSETSSPEEIMTNKKVDQNSVNRKRNTVRKSKANFDDRYEFCSHSLQKSQQPVTRARLSLSWTNSIENSGQIQTVQNHPGVLNNHILYSQDDSLSTMRQNQSERTSTNKNTNVIQDGGILANLSPKITGCVKDSCIGSESELCTKIGSDQFQNFKALDEYAEKNRNERFGQVIDLEINETPYPLNNCRTDRTSKLQ
ncbi:hypothetical protein ScPMuIL_001111 [Solemya velum]